MTSTRNGSPQGEPGSSATRMSSRRRLDDRLLVGVGGGALLGREEARAHLHAVGAQRDEAPDVLVRVDPAGDDHGEVPVAARGLLDRGEQRLEGVLRQVDLVHPEAEVAPGQRSLEDDRVRALPLALPAAADEVERPAGRDDRHERGVPRLLDGGQRQRQPRARDDRVGAGVDRRAHRGLVVALERHHDVDPGEAPPRLRERDLLVDGVVGVRLLPAALGDEPVEAGAREHPEPPRGRDGAARGARETPTPIPPWTIGRGRRLPLIISDGNAFIMTKIPRSREKGNRKPCRG